MPISGTPSLLIKRLSPKHPRSQNFRKNRRTCCPKTQRSERLAGLHFHSKKRRSKMHVSRRWARRRAETTAIVHQAREYPKIAHTSQYCILILLLNARRSPGVPDNSPELTETRQIGRHGSGLHTTQPAAAARAFLALVGRCQRGLAKGSFAIQTMHLTSQGACRDRPKAMDRA